MLIFRGAYPNPLHEFMNHLMSEIYLREYNQFVRRQSGNREVGFHCPTKHYTVHPYNREKRNTRVDGRKAVLKLYKEAGIDLSGFIQTLPHWRCVDKFLREHCPSIVAEGEGINPHDIKVADTFMNGLALAFFPVYGHRDMKDRAAGLLSYLHGPFQSSWMGGAFLVRMFGLRVPVKKQDVLVFVSRLWHEVESTTGVRFSLVSYLKKFGSRAGGIQGIHIPEDLKWIFKPDFGLFPSVWDPEV